MTKSHSSGLAISNLFHVGNVSGLRKLKTQSKSDSMEFPALISQQDANLTMERLAKKVSESHIISDDERTEIVPMKALEHRTDVELLDNIDEDDKKTDGVLPEEKDVSYSTMKVCAALEPRSDLTALWQHLNGNGKSPEILDSKLPQSPIKMDLQNVALVQKQTIVREFKSSIGSTKKPVESDPESMKANAPPKFLKSVAPDVNIVADIEEELQVEKIPIKVMAVETHFAFNSGPSLGFQLGGAVAEHLKSEVTKLQLSSSKPILDPNTALVRSLHIQLIPESLGELKVQMHLRGSELTLKIEVSSRLAAMKLSEDKDMLKDLLEKAGFEMTGEPVMIVVRSDQSTNSDARMNDQPQDRQPAADNGTLNYGKNFGDGNEKQQKHDHIRNTENQPSMRSQELVEPLTGRNERSPDSNSASGMYL